MYPVQSAPVWPQMLHCPVGGQSFGCRPMENRRLDPTVGRVDCELDVLDQLLVLLHIEGVERFFLAYGVVPLGELLGGLLDRVCHIPASLSAASQTRSR